MPGIKRLIPRLIAAIAVAAVALTLLPSPAAADHGTHHVRDGICGYTEDLYETDGLGNVQYEKDAQGEFVLDTNGDKIPIPSDQKYLMRYVQIRGKLVCSDNDGAWPLTGSTTSASTISGIFRSRPNADRKNWCINTMFQNAARVPNTDTAADGTATSTITLRLKNTSKNTQDDTRQILKWHSNERVLDFDDLVAGAHFCRVGTF